MKKAIMVLFLILAGLPRGGAALEAETICEEKCSQVIQEYAASGRSCQDAPYIDELIIWASVYTNNPTVQFATAVRFLSAKTGRSNVEALPYLKAAYENSSGNAVIGNTYAHSLSVGRQKEAAKAVLREVIAHSPWPSNLCSKLVLALLLEQTQDYEEALGLLQEQNDFWRARGVQFGPKPNEDYATILMHIGVCQMYLGRHAESIQTLALAESYWPTAAHILNCQAEAYLKGGRPDKAKEILLFTKANHRSDESTFYHLGMLEKETDPALAASYFEKAFELGAKRLAGSSDIGSVYYMMSNIAEELGKETLAAQYKEEARRLGFTFSAPWVHDPVLHDPECL